MAIRLPRLTPARRQLLAHAGLALFGLAGWGLLTWAVVCWLGPTWWLASSGLLLLGLFGFRFAAHILWHGVYLLTRPKPKESPTDASAHPRRRRPLS